MITSSRFSSCFSTDRAGKRNIVYSIFYEDKKCFKSAFLPPKNLDFSLEGFWEMDINKVDLLLKYLLVAGGQEDFGNREVVWLDYEGR
jgi:hypothetical protein